MTLFLSVCVYWAEDVEDYDEGGWFSEEENNDWNNDIYENRISKNI